MTKNTIGIILFGGKSSRMGSPKQNLTYKNVTFKNIAINLFTKAKLAKIYLIGQHDLAKHSSENLQKQALAEISDKKPNLGPIAAIYTISKLINDNQMAIIIPIDMPKLSLQIINNLITVSQKNFIQNKTEATHYKDFVFPLALTFTKNVKEVLDNTVTNGTNNLSIRKFCDSVDTIEISMDSWLIEFFDNINTLDDYKKLKSGK